MKANRLRIGQVAKRARVGIETVRFYERQGLIPEPPRNSSGYRQFPEQTVARIEFIQRAQELGFSLREIAELLDLKVDGPAQCTDVRGRAEAKIGDIETKLRDLGRMRESLLELVGVCIAEGSTGQCPILDALGGKEVDAALHSSDGGAQG